MALSRQQIIAALREALEPLDHVHAMWEGGAAAFHRVDEYSDIDLLVDVDDDGVAAVPATVERRLADLSPIQLKYDVPQPTWHGHWQTFYRLSGTSEFLLLDFVVIKHSNPEKFLQPEIHGRALVHFDKANVVQCPPLQVESAMARLKARLDSLRVTFDLFQSLTLKELARGNDLEALAFYQGFTLRPLVEVLRIRHKPTRHGFHTRYIHYDLPADVVTALQRLFFVNGAEDLRLKRDQAERWFHDTLEQIDFAEVATLMTQASANLSGRNLPPA